MNAYTIPIWLFWTLFCTLAFVAGMFLALWLKLLLIERKDAIIIIDKNDRWTLHRLDLLGKDTVDIGKHKYILQKEGSILNARGKTLYVFSENKPNPLEIKFCENKWLDSKTIYSVVNNEIAREIIKPKQAIIDLLIIMGSVSAILVLMISTANLLVSMGVITPK